MLTDGTWYNDPAQPASHLALPPPRPPPRLPFARSLFPHIHVHSFGLSRPLSLSFFLSLSSSRPRGSICLVYTLYVHLPTAKTTLRTKPKQCCQTSVRRVAWPFAFRLCRDTEYFANAFYRGIFGPLVGWRRQAPTLFA